jgi:CMP-N-acetylneuraminic acid synthetase
LTSRPRVVALMPMRADSERIPAKNVRPFAGRPLYRHMLETLLAIPGIDEVVIDTDAQPILDEVAQLYPGVRLLVRPPHLRDGLVAMNDVLLHDVEQVEADLLVQTHSTNPLLQAATIERALRAFAAARPRHDSLFGVTRLQTRLYDHAGRPLNHDPAVLLRTQDLPPVYEENSCLYVFPPEVLRSRRNRIGDRPLLFEIPRPEAFDIDELLDFEMAEFLFRRERR